MRRDPAHDHHPSSRPWISRALHVSREEDESGGGARVWYGSASAWSARASDMIISIIGRHACILAGRGKRQRQRTTARSTCRHARRHVAAVCVCARVREREREGVFLDHLQMHARCQRRLLRRARGCGCTRAGRRESERLLRRIDSYTPR